MSEDLSQIRQRLIDFMDMEGIKPTQLADMIGVKRATVSHILNERNKPSLDFVVKFLNKFDNINPDWLLKGEKPIYRVSPHSSLLGGAQQETLFKPEEESNTIEPTNTKVTEVQREHPEDDKTEQLEHGKRGNPIIDNNPDKLKQDPLTPEQILVLFPDKTFVAYKERK